MTLLSFNSKFVVQSTTPVSTTSTTLVDDTQASQTFTLTGSQTVLVIYQANSVHGDAMGTHGMQNAISIDGVDRAPSYDSPFNTNYVARNTTFWIGTLAAGAHTIKGRFARNVTPDTATISNRILLIYIFDGTEFQYVDDTTQATTTSGTLVDDPNASVSFTPSGSCIALFLYNCSNLDSAVESTTGKIAAINLAGSDFAQAEKSPDTSNFPDSVFTCYAASLTAVLTAVKGRFASNSAGNTVTINRRQLGVLLLKNDTLLDIVNNTTQVSTTSSALVDDAQASISRTTTESRELLVVTVGTKRAGTTSSQTGECYGIMTDTVDRQNSKGSPSDQLSADSAGTCYAITTSAAAHTVKGRFSNNNDADIAKIDARVLIALWLSVAPPPSMPPNSLMLMGAGI